MSAPRNKRNETKNEIGYYKVVDIVFFGLLAQKFIMMLSSVLILRFSLFRRNLKSKCTLNDSKWSFSGHCIKSNGWAICPTQCPAPIVGAGHCRSAMSSIHDCLVDDHLHLA